MSDKIRNIIDNTNQQMQELITGKDLDIEEVKELKKYMLKLNTLLGERNNNELYCEFYINHDIFLRRIKELKEIELNNKFVKSKWEDIIGFGYIITENEQS